MSGHCGRASRVASACANPAHTASAAVNGGSDRCTSATATARSSSRAAGYRKVAVPREVARPRCASSGAGGSLERRCRVAPARQDCQINRSAAPRVPRWIGAVALVGSAIAFVLAAGEAWRYSVWATEPPQSSRLCRGRPVVRVPARPRDGRDCGVVSGWNDQLDQRSPSRTDRSTTCGSTATPASPTGWSTSCAVGSTSGEGHFIESASTHSVQLPESGYPSTVCGLLTCPLWTLICMTDVR
jgi:hypothetical protein